MGDLAFVEHAPLSGKAPKQLVVLIHGYGADGRDLIDLADDFGRVLPDAHFIAPHAPDPCEIASFGRQWFSLTGDTPGRRWLGVTAAAPRLNDFLDAQSARFGLGAENLALLGFSQGTMMALHVGLRRTEPLAGILGYSGMLIGPDHLKAEIRSRPPIHLIHGMMDSVVPIEASRLALTYLRAEGLQAGLLERAGLGHGIDAGGIASGARFLVECFNSTA